MAFVLVNFFEENQCDVVPISRVILPDGEDCVKQGMKAFVKWPSKIRGKSPLKVIAEITDISGLLNSYVTIKASYLLYIPTEFLLTPYI